MFAQKLNAPTRFAYINGLKHDPGFPAGTETIRVSKGWRTYFLYPWHGAPWSPGAGESVLNWILEMVACWLLSFFVNLVAFHGTPASVIDGVAVGLIYALVWRMAWGWNVKFALRRHMNWIITMGYSLIGRGSLLACLYYFTAQYIGALLGGLTVKFFNAAGVPNYDTLATDGQIAFILCVAGFFVVFTIIYNDFFEFSQEDELENHQNVGDLSALVLFLFTALFFRFQQYSFGNVVYFAAITSVNWDSALTNIPATGLIDYGAELGFVVLVVVLFFFL